MLRESLLILVCTIVAIGFGQESTLNQSNEKGKQGRWIYYGKDKPEAGFAETAKVEEGAYVEDRKFGLWIRYQSDGQTIKAIGAYYDNRPHSPHDENTIVEGKLNQTDEKGKQGHWVYYGKDRPDAGIPPEGKLEEGFYVNDRKEGLWIKYNNDGVTPKLVGVYSNNRPSGSYVRPYPQSGKITETVACDFKPLTTAVVSDTLNRTDSNGLKQGYWILYGKDMPGDGYPDGGKIEEGSYVGGNKEGIWTKYHYDGKTPKLTGNYKAGKPHGSYQKFYANGIIKERGTFQYKHLIDSLVIYDIEGKVICSEFFDTTGVCLYTNCDKLEPKAPEVICFARPQPYKGDPPSFRPNGYNKIYNQDNNIWQEGIYKDGKLQDGQLFVYDRNSKLIRTEEYKDGVMVNEIVHP